MSSGALLTWSYAVSSGALLTWSSAVSRGAPLTWSFAVSNSDLLAWSFAVSRLRGAAYLELCCVKTKGCCLPGALLCQD